MLNFVQAFFVIFIKTIAFFIFFHSCASQTFKFNNQSSCFESGILPNPLLFDYSSINITLLESPCKMLRDNQNLSPTTIDGLSFSTFISIPSDCIFEEDNIPKKIFTRNAHILLWDYTHNEFLDFWLLYQSKKPCGFIIFPKSKFQDSSHYLFIMKKTFFINSLKKEYINDATKLWYDFKSKKTLNYLNQKQIHFIKTIIESYKNLYPFHPDESIYTIFAIRSANGLFVPFLDYIDKRKQWVSIEIISKKLMEGYIPEKEGYVYKINFREKALSPNHHIKILYAGVSNMDYTLKLDYENSIYMYIPYGIDKNILNIILVNGNIIKLPLFRKLAQLSNSVIISYFIFKDPYLNLLNDIIIYENINQILKVYFKKFQIIRIYKICIKDKECIISTFFQEKISNIISFDIPISRTPTFEYIEMKSILDTLKLTDGRMILNIFSKQLKNDIFDFSLYIRYKNKLSKHLNYDFTIHELNFSSLSFNIYELLNILKK